MRRRCCCVGDFKCEARFSWSFPTADCTLIQFHDDTQVAAGYTIISWSWQFHDGTTSDEQHPLFQTFIRDVTATLTIIIVDDNDPNRRCTATLTRTFTVPCTPPRCRSCQDLADPLFPQNKTSDFLPRTILFTHTTAILGDQATTSCPGMVSLGNAMGGTFPLSRQTTEACGWVGNESIRYLVTSQWWSFQYHSALLVHDFSNRTFDPRFTFPPFRAWCISIGRTIRFYNSQTSPTPLSANTLTFVRFPIRLAQGVETLNIDCRNITPNVTRYWDGDKNIANWPMEGAMSVVCSLDQFQFPPRDFLEVRSRNPTVSDPAAL